MQRFYLFVLACSSWLAQPPAAQAQNPAPAATAANSRSIGLAEAVQLALAASKDLKRNEAAQRQAAARVQQARDGVVPGVQLSSTFLRLSDNVTPFSVGLPGRGDVVLNPQILNQSYNSLQVRQLLWAGGKVRLGIEAARREQEATQAEADQYRLLAADNVTTIWYDLYTLNASEKIIRENSALLQDRRRELTNLERQGVVLKIDGLKIELAIARLESALADIRSGQAINSFNLALATGLPTSTTFAPTETALPAAQPLPPLADYQQQALASRAELKAMTLRREAALVGQRIVRGNTLPVLSFGGTVDYNRPNLRVFPAEAQFKATSSVFANLTWDVGSLYANRARVAETRFGLEQLGIGLEQLSEGIQIEVNASYRAYEQALEKIRVAENAITLAEENFRVEQNRFKASTITPADFLDANTQLVQARLDLTTAQANAELARWKLLKSTGRLTAN
ncbi:TolC family protein [Hymenobacter sp. IS2118]|uniref:TolC family protein n=1 Tax=Hymenobacter sp. IS2118 TaxID=1505605 RepID=UPI000556E161|nr:TolC family protein [Hymenobacter sp. IS2118]